MANTALEKINEINKGLQWIKQHEPEQYDQRFLQLVDERRKLRVLAKAEASNAGIAAFGNSQVGKSYLMNCLLQDQDKPFMVEHAGGECNFIETINPIGEGAEATGVVTRFSAYNKHPELYDVRYPIRFRSYNIKDVIITICDAYFNDFRNYGTEGEANLNEKSKALYDKYAPMTVQPFCPITADDVLDMKAYFKRYINNAQVYTSKTDYFDKIALVIEKVPVEDYVSIFGIIWQQNPEFTSLFNACLSILRRLKFEEYLYLPISAVMHGGLKEDTIMSVSCLKLLFEAKARDYMTSIYRKTDDGYESLGEFTKSELCTVCSEVVIKIRDQFIASTGEYDFRDISGDVAAKLTRERVTMSILNHCDLLDFPGARAREDLLLEKISDKGELMYAFLRGKVAYLFNRYNEEKTINILLFCHHHKHLEATQMQHLLRGWVHEYVGETPAKRAELIGRTGLSPLFHIGTMWNMNLGEVDNKELGMSDNAIKARWSSRFEEILANQCYHRSANEWVDNWTGSGRPFQNSYMLRDFKFSESIYSGFKVCGKEDKMLIPRDYYDRMRRLFCESNERHHFFADPELAWDVSASVGNDGSLYIIEQLSKVAKNISAAREVQIKEQMAAVCTNCYRILFEYFKSSDADELLESNIRKANSIFREMEFSCQANPEYFGHLLQALQLTEAETYKALHALMPTLTSTVHDDTLIVDYELIRKRCCEFEGCKTESEKWQRILDVYRFSSVEEATDFLAKKKIDVQQLFRGETIKRRNSAVISHVIMSMWKQNITDSLFMNKFTGENRMDEIAMSNLTESLISTATFVGLGDKIESSISSYVDVLNATTLDEKLVADMLSTAISDFVIDFGYRYLSDDKIEMIKRVSALRGLPCFDWLDKERREVWDDDGMTALLNEILVSDRKYTPAYEANYNCWMEYMYISFIANLNVPDFDREANENLKKILDELKVNHG